MVRNFSTVLVCVNVLFAEFLVGLLARYALEVDEAVERVRLVKKDPALLRDF